MLYGEVWPVSYIQEVIAASLLPLGKVPDGTLGSLATLAGDADAAPCDDDDEPETDDEAEETA